ASVGGLTADVHRLEVQADVLREPLARTEEDVAALKDAAGRVAEQVERLKAERDLAAARFTASSALAAEAQRSRADRIRRLVAVDAARDEVERAHALAEVWRGDGEPLPGGLRGDHRAHQRWLRASGRRARR